MVVSVVMLAIRLDTSPVTTFSTSAVLDVAAPSSDRSIVNGLGNRQPADVARAVGSSCWAA